MGSFWHEFVFGVHAAALRLIDMSTVVLFVNPGPPGGVFNFKEIPTVSESSRHRVTICS